MINSKMYPSKMTKDEKNLQGLQEKKKSNNLQVKGILTSDVSKATYKARQENSIFLKQGTKVYEPRILYPVKLSFKL